MEKICVTSRVSRKNAIYTVAGLGLILFILAGDIYRWFYLRSYHPAELLLVSALLVFYAERVGARYFYQANSSSLVIQKKSLFGIRKQEIPYAGVLGIYRYKAKLVGVMKFRRTFRWHSALDDREVWVLAYTVPQKDGKRDNQRIYFKPGDEMMDFMEKHLRGKVRVTEEKVVQESLRQP